MTYGMYTHAGDDAVEESLGKVVSMLEQTHTRITEDELWTLLQQIQTEVKQKGIGQSNPSKYSEEYEEDDESRVVQGFDEVTDTVVRDNIYTRLVEYVQEE